MKPVPTFRWTLPIATPVSTQPIALGADYVVHSLTKYICGHGDALGGAIVVRDHQRLPELRRVLVHQGAALHPFAAWLIAIARQLAERLRVFAYAVSLGKTKSLLFYIPTDDILRTSFQLDPPGAASYRSVDGDGLFRVSLGLEHPEDLIRDLDQALA